MKFAHRSLFLFASMVAITGCELSSGPIPPGDLFTGVIGMLALLVSFSLWWLQRRFDEARRLEEEKERAEKEEVDDVVTALRAILRPLTSAHDAAFSYIRQYSFQNESFPGMRQLFGNAIGQAEEARAQLRAHRLWMPAQLYRDLHEFAFWCQQAVRIPLLGGELLAAAQRKAMTSAKVVVGVKFEFADDADLGDEFARVAAELVADHTKLRREMTGV